MNLAIEVRLYLDSADTGMDTLNARDLLRKFFDQVPVHPNFERLTKLQQVSYDHYDAILHLLAALVSIEGPSRFAVAPLSFRGSLRPVSRAGPFTLVVVIRGSGDVFATTASDEPLSSYNSSNLILLCTPLVAAPTCPFGRSRESDFAAVFVFSPWAESPTASVP